MIGDPSCTGNEVWGVVCWGAMATRNLIGAPALPSVLTPDAVVMSIVSEFGKREPRCSLPILDAI